MSVICPYCQFSIKLKSVKAGRFTPKCPKCTKAFLLTVPADPGQQPVVATLANPGETVVTTGVPAPAKPAPDQTAVGSTGAWAAPPAAAAHAPDATGAWTPSAVGQPAAEGTAIFNPPPSPDATMALPPESGKTSPAASGQTEAGAATPAPLGGDGDIPAALGGYSVVKLLGKGGMGAVYLARQVSLDRNVALKVMNPQWAKDPAFLSRFTREAYAAAQLVHHNIVQIYDIGEDHDTPFFSMEFVPGQNLMDLAKAQGKLDVEEAVGYILQAARGLKFAHDQGMVHRDIKPDNLMLNDQGIVKVADLGLVKTAGMVPADDQPASGAPRPASMTGLASLPSVTNVGVAMGTPAYMAPEQGRNAANVDHRADIYSLGCTLYVLLTGRPPFSGKSALEVMTKHLTDPVIPPETFVKRVPKELSAILMKMLAKKPEDRYADLGAVIASLEKFLGVVSTGPFTPKDEHAATLDSAVKQFNNAPAAKQRALAKPAFLGVIALAFFLCVVTGHAKWAGYVFGLGLLTVAGTFLTSGIVYRTHLFIKTREMVLDSHWTDWLKWGVGALLSVMAAYLILGPLAFFVVLLLAAGVCALYHLLIERKLADERRKALAKAEGLLKTLRLRGLEEEALRQFVAKYSGDHWEELYEALFGYELMVQTRRRLQATEGGKRRAQYAAWRDPVVVWLEARQRAARAKRERLHLLKIEKKRLEAEGVSAGEAKSRAEAAAEVMVEAAAGMKQQAVEATGEFEGTPDAPAAPPKPLFNAKKLMEAAAKAEREHATRIKPKGPSVAQILYSATIGPQPRFIVAAVLIFGCLLWLWQNKEVWDKIKDVTSQTLELGTVSKEQAAVEYKPLRLPGLPESVGDIFGSFNPGIAGILLIFSAIWRSPRITIFFFAAVVVLVFGKALGVPGFDAPFYGRVPAETVCLALGLALAVVGVVVDRLLSPKDAGVKRW